MKQVIGSLGHYGFIGLVYLPTGWLGMILRDLPCTIYGMIYSRLVLNPMYGIFVYLHGWLISMVN